MAAMEDHDTAIPPPQDAWIATPAGRLFSRRWSPAAAASQAAGSGPRAPIVLFHDSLGCVELWRDFPAVLCQATGRDVIAYDRLGFGRSDPRAGVPPPDFVAEEAALGLPALRAHWGVGRFVALGHSVGGGMAAHCAAAAPGDCEALVTIAAQACVEARTLQGIREAQAQFAASPGQLDRLARYHGGSTERARWVLSAWVDRWLDPAFAGWSLQGAMARVTCPVLALHGERDEYGSPDQPARIAHWAAGPAQVCMLPGQAHSPHREQPAAVAARVADFLARTQAN
ncbi:alpha/beta hydrolase [Acidovorax sp. FG27]|uniref:alpha/beta fold hydrolase n=1 Tax=Acidovorax sp. FG27 TaxID=3133652 RepID=UPI0030E809D5